MDYDPIYSKQGWVLTCFAGSGSSNTMSNILEKFCPKWWDVAPWDTARVKLSLITYIFKSVSGAWGTQHNRREVTWHQTEHRKNKRALESPAHN